MIGKGPTVDRLLGADALDRRRLALDEQPDLAVDRPGVDGRMARVELGDAPEPGVELVEVIGRRGRGSQDGELGCARAGDDG